MTSVILFFFDFVRADGGIDLLNELVLASEPPLESNDRFLRSIDGRGADEVSTLFTFVIALENETLQTSKTTADGG